jgi:pre-mRNA-splicing helicase BRR2
MSHPVYNTILQHTTSEPVLVFVPSLHQTRLSAVDLLMYAAAEGRPRQFLRCQESDLLPYLEKISNTTLKETLVNGVGYYNAGLSESVSVTVEHGPTGGHRCSWWSCT